MFFKFYRNGYHSDNDYQIGGNDLKQQTGIHSLQPSAFSGLRLVLHLGQFTNLSGVI
ncbi:hypothetical protein [Leuconostoc litchii]|uniref:hypothetical protein n=1 Tax=Leuconostoc litchii TaxID=1981069 RepID=UPI001FCA8E60|nr:hypothetical protein [Leuconostoc litchii]